MDGELEQQSIEAVPDTEAVPAASAIVTAAASAATAVGSADGFSFTSDGKRIVVSGSNTVAPVVPMGPGGVTVLPIVRREFDDANAIRFDRVPGVLVRPGDRAVSFANRFFAVVASDSADALFSYNVSAGTLLDRVDLGPSMGLVAVSPDRQTLVVSAGGGLGVFQVDIELFPGHAQRLTQRFRIGLSHRHRFRCWPQHCPDFFHAQSSGL